MAELDLVLAGWPQGSRAICRRERPHPGPQLTFSDADGHRFQVLLTNQHGDPVALEARHRARARCVDRIRAAKNTGLSNLPFRDFTPNAAWLELVLMAQDLLCWAQSLLLEGDLARRAHAPALPAPARGRPDHPLGAPHPASTVRALALGARARGRLRAAARAPRSRVERPGLREVEGWRREGSRLPANDSTAAPKSVEGLPASVLVDISAAPGATRRLPHGRGVTSEPCCTIRAKYAARAAHPAWQAPRASIPLGRSGLPEGGFRVGGEKLAETYQKYGR